MAKLIKPKITTCGDKEFLKNSISIPKSILEDKLLDYKSRGILVTLLSLPEEFHCSAKNIAAYVDGDGAQTTSRLLQKLEQLGYLRRILSQYSSNSFPGYDYIINIPPIKDGMNYKTRRRQKK